MGFQKRKSNYEPTVYSETHSGEAMGIQYTFVSSVLRHRTIVS